MKRMIVLVAACAALCGWGEPLIRPGDNVILVGDSITEIGFRTPTGFYHQLTNAAMAVAADKGYSFVPLGFSGYTVSTWMSMERECLKRPQNTNYRPGWNLGTVFSNHCDVIVVFLGMNDILCPTVRDDDESLRSWQAKYRTFLANLRNRCHPRLFVLATITPLTADPEGPKNIVRRRMNALVAELAEEFGGVVADYGAAIEKMQDETSLADASYRPVPDFVHPNAMGHTLIAKALCETLGDAALAGHFSAKAEREWKSFLSTRQDGLGYRFRLRRTCRADDDDLVYDIDWKWNGSEAPEEVSFHADRGWRLNMRSARASSGRLTAIGRPCKTHNFITFRVRCPGGRECSKTFSIPVPWRVSEPFDFDAVWQRRPWPSPAEWKTNAVPPVSLSQASGWTLCSGNWDYTGDVDRGSLDPYQVFFGTTCDSFYAKRWVRVSDDRDLTGELSHKTFSATLGLKVWIDGAEVFSGCLDRFGHNCERFPLRLKTGWHEIAIRCDHLEWQRQFSFDLLDATGKTPHDLEWSWKRPLDMPTLPGLAPLKPNERVTFFGDSITHCGDYIYYLQLFENLRHPELNVRFDNCGWSGDTASGGLNRWPWDGRHLNADRVVVMFGSNDVGGHLYPLEAPSSETLKQRAKRIAAFETNMVHLIEFLQKEGKRVELMSSKPFDEFSTKLTATNRRDFNALGLSRAAEIVRGCARREKIGFVDNYFPLLDFWRRYPDRGLGGPDRMHPKGEGHLLMTANILASLGEGATVASVDLDAASGKVSCVRASVSDCSVGLDGVSFVYAPESLPFPLLPEVVRDDEIYPFSERFNREPLKVSGLSDGRWRVLADGREIGVRTARELALGVDLARLDTPSARIARGAAEKMERLHRLEKDLRLLPMKLPIIRRAGVDPNDTAASVRALDAYIERLPEDQRRGWDGLTCRQWKELRPKERELREECERLRQEMRVRPKPYRIEIRREKETVAELPAEMRERDPMRVMSLDDAWSVRTKTRIRFVLNGLWQMQDPKNPLKWTWAKLPGGVWMDGTPRTYRRQFTMPAEAAGRRIVLSFPHLNPVVSVRVDGQVAGTCDYPEGLVDLTPLAKPGCLQTIEIRTEKADLSSDFFLDILPPGARIEDPWVECSVSNREIRFSAGGVNLPGKLRLSAEIEGCGDKRRFESSLFEPGTNGIASFTASWPDAKRWDLHTTSNLYACTLVLQDADGRILDCAYPFRFGFREVRIEGNRLLLNGIPVHLRGLMCPLVCDQPQFAVKLAAHESCRRLRMDGYNFVTDTYAVRRGTYRYMDGMFEACDESGILYCLTLPNISDFGMAKINVDAKATAQYRKEVRHLVKMARNHPAVIAYAINHNTISYPAAIDPVRIDGRHPLTDERAAVGGLKYIRSAAERVWRIIKEEDPTRPCHHHDSGDFGEWVTANCYLDWMPPQERSDYLEHWSKSGVKPLFLVEWGMPHIANWSSFRGPEFIWENKACQSLVAAEAASAFRGDAAFEASPSAFEALRREERLWKTGKPWSWRNDQSQDCLLHENNFIGIQSLFMAENWRCLRAWGLTAAVPWDQGRSMYRRVGGTGKSSLRPDRYENLKSPGPVPDFTGTGHNWKYIVDAGPASDWEHTEVARTIRRWNQDDCAFIGGAGTFTDKRHLFRPGDLAEKSLVFVNDCRTPRTYRWRLELRKEDRVVETKDGSVTVQPGTRGESPVSFRLAEPGFYVLRAGFSAEGWQGADQFTFSVFPPVSKNGNPTEKVALYDPKGLTKTNFIRLQIPFYEVKDLPSATEAARARRLVVGREGLTAELVDGILSETYNQSQVLVFEQTKPVLESLGFRVQEYGLRNGYSYVREPALGTVTLDKLRDWTGASTLVPVHNWGDDPRAFPTSTWAGYEVRRVCRAGNRGAIATVVPEIPTRGDWLPLVSGGWNLQYAPLLDWRCDFARITFCQLDVTGRTESDPMADDLVRGLVARLAKREALKAAWTKSEGVAARRWLRDSETGVLWEKGQSGRDTYVFSSGAEKPTELDRKVAEEGARVLCAGFGVDETLAWCPKKVSVVQTNGAYFARIKRIPSELNGCSNAEWAWHGAMDFAAFADPCDEGNAALRVIRHGKGYYVFMQVAPWMIDDGAKPYLRPSRRKAEYLFQRILGNMGVSSRGRRVHYADAPVPGDDPYRFYKW